MFNHQPKENGIFSGVVTAYSILILHVVLIAVIGVLVLFFRGVVAYMFWIFLAVIAIAAISFYVFYRRLKAQRLKMMETLDTPAFRSRPVEISVLGGLASLRVGTPTADPHSGAEVKPVLQLEDQESMKLRKLNELARLFEKELITRDEYQTLKKELLEAQPIYLHDNEAP